MKTFHSLLTKISSFDKKKGFYLTALSKYAGVILAMFVGTVATTLTFASLGLVAVASGAGTTAAAGRWTRIMFNTIVLVHHVPATKCIDCVNVGGVFV